MLKENGWNDKGDVTSSEVGDGGLDTPFTVFNLGNIRRNHESIR